jgi:type 1 fimbriae regulatory protein FimB/type 1 fimbriae regulatory protein FimE
VTAQKIQIIRKKNETYRSREHLTADEVYTLIDAAGNRGRHKMRDRCLVLLMFRHGLRASEAATLKWDAVMFKTKELRVNRLKGSRSGNHPLQPDELEALTAVKNFYPNSIFVFPGERGDHLSVDGIEKIVARAAQLAGMHIKVHPHMLRHSCGFFLADKGYPTRDIQDWLGHASIHNTVIYTAQNSKRFSKFDWNWQEEESPF